MEARNSVSYALAGAALALGAPLGWLAVRGLQGGLSAGVGAELQGHLALYLYLLGSTAAVFAGFGAWLGHVSDRLQAANAQLERLATTDGLTRLRNARHFHQQLEQECARADREHAPLTLILLDLDHFKRVNDRYGHSTGDEVLVHTARLLGLPLRATDTACRIGGEEFAVLCPGATKEEGRAIAERIREALDRTPHLSSEGQVPLTGSFGVAEHRHGGSPRELFRDADAALYVAKGQGRNRVETAPSLEARPAVPDAN